MKKRRSALVGVAIVVLVAGAGASLVRAGGLSGGPSRRSDAPVHTLRIYYRSPVLARAGERVVMPVHVVCATARGEACDAAVTIEARVGRDGPWLVRRAEAGPGLAFDLTGPAARAGASSRDRSVEFLLRASAGGVHASLPAYRAEPLRFYVAERMPILNIPAVPFGHVRSGRTVLLLPWGSGPRRAGLELGRESPTLGPPSFAVDSSGHVHVLDSLQGRIGEFAAGRLVRARDVGATANAHLALGGDGTAYVADAAEGGVTVTRIAPSGRTSATASLGPGVLSDIRSVGATAYVEMVPLEAWVPVAAGGPVSSSPVPVTGRPLDPRQQLLRGGTEERIRLGIVRGGRVHSAVELRSAHRFGEVALAEPDGVGGYVVVVRVWRSPPRPADQFQVIRISQGRVGETFTVSSRGFASTPPLSRFRLGPDGHLYQLITTPEGVRIVRFELKGES